jgi:glucosamine--fructose-6-phosphate aminotransferase (isomerizing)
MTFEEEIRQTPTALRRLLDHWSSEARASARQARSAVPRIRQVVFTGMGSSLNAAYPAKYLLARHGLAARLEPASELFYDLLSSMSDDTLVVAISQSGETIETNNVLDALRGHRHLWVVANDEASRMARSGRPFFPIKAGVETRTSSKSYTNTLALLYLLAEQIGGTEKPTPAAEWNSICAAAEATLSVAGDVAARMLHHWGSLDRLHVVARGPSLATASQFSLILAETTSAFAQPVDGGTFRHGFNLLAAPGHELLVLLPDSPTAELSLKIAGQAAERGSRVVALSSRALPPRAGTSDRLLMLPLRRVAPDLAPLLEILPLEVATVARATREGRDPGPLASKVAPEE